MRSTKAEPQARRSLNLASLAANSEERGEGQESEDAKDTEGAKQQAGSGSAEAGPTLAAAAGDRKSSKRVSDENRIEESREEDADGAMERHTQAAAVQKPSLQSKESLVAPDDEGQRDDRVSAGEQRREVVGKNQGEEEEGTEAEPYSEAAKTTPTAANVVTPVAAAAVTSTVPASNPLTAPLGSARPGLDPAPESKADLLGTATASAGKKPEVSGATQQNPDLTDVDADVESLRKLLTREREARAASEQALMDELTWLKEEGRRAEERLRAELAEVQEEREEALRKLEEEVESAVR